MEEVLKEVATIFNQHSTVIYALLLIFVIDFITGTAVAIKDKQLASKNCIDGLMRKVGILLLIVAVFIIDILWQQNGVLLVATTTAFLVGDFISIVENITLLGVKMPKAILDILKKIESEETK